MTMRTPGGKTLNRQVRDAQAKFEYLAKLTNNTAPTLNRIGSVAVAKFATRPKSGENRMILSVRGDHDESARIAKVLGSDVTVDQIHGGATVPVKFSRITVMVTFKQDPAAVNNAQEKVQRRAA